jgi:hypothetical protein
MFNICQKVDQALVDYIVSSGAGKQADTFPAKRSASKVIPCTICYAHSFETARETGIYSGNVKVDAFVEVRTSAIVEETQMEGEPEEESADRVGDTFSLFFYGTGDSGSALAAAITAASSVRDLTLQNVMVIGGTQGFNPRNPKLDGHTWVDSIHLEILCRPS